MSSWSQFCIAGLLILHYFLCPLFPRSTKSACIILGHSVETICFASPSDLPSIATTDSHYPETAHLIATCQRMKRELATLPVPEPGVQKSITGKHTDCIVRQIETLLRAPLCVPRFYFQVLQSTGIKLSVTPQSRVAGDPVIVMAGSGLVVKIEGVIQHSGRRPCRFRTIDSVQLTLTAQLTAGGKSTASGQTGGVGGLDDVVVQLTQTVRPHRDFLSGSFLVPLNGSGGGAANGGAAGCGGVYGGAGGGGGVNGGVGGGGNWLITLEACVVDDNSVLWNTGPKR